MKIIISAMIEIDPKQRDMALLDASPVIKDTLAEPGCIHYNWAADAINLGLIVVYEEWSSEETLDLHFTTENFTKMHAILGQRGLIKASATKFAVNQEGPVFNSDGVATSKF